jgi:GT2 family glycosyltransferase
MLSESLRQYLDKHSKIILLEISKNIGLPAAWNLGIDLLDCDYIFFLNDDLWLDQKCIYEIVEVFKSKPDSAVVGVEGVCCSKLGENGFPVTEIKYKKKRKYFQRKNIVDVTNVSGFFFALSIEFVRKTSFRFDARFSPAFCEEFDLAFFARNNGYKTRIILGLDKHYDHSFGISSGPKEIKYLGKSIWSNELSERNVKLFCQKWDKSMRKFLKP